VKGGNSPSDRGNNHSKFIGHLLNQLEATVINNGVVSNEATQKRIENIIFDEFDLFVSNKNKNILGNSDLPSINSPLSRYVIDKQKLLEFYLGKLQKSSFLDTLSGSNREEKEFIIEIIVTIDKEFLLNLCLLHYVLVYAHQNTDNDKYYHVTKMSISIGSKMIYRYFNILKNKYMKNNNCDIKYLA